MSGLAFEGPVAKVPEPTALILVSLGVAGLGLARCRKAAV
jgi:hypothetical protein